MTDRTMPPVGPEMDALVAEALGEDTKFPAYYSRDTHGMALDALEAWREQHPDTSWQTDYSHVLDRHRCIIETARHAYEAKAPTLEAAICQVIIRAHWALEDAKC